MTTVEIDHMWNGRARLQMGDVHCGSYPVTVTVWPQFGIIQPGSDDKYLPEHHLEQGKSYRFDVGDFEFTVKRKRKSYNVINLNEARLSRPSKRVKS